MGWDQYQILQGVQDGIAGYAELGQSFCVSWIIDGMICHACEHGSDDRKYESSET
jgi:hypothetical protein